MGTVGPYVLLKNYTEEEEFIFHAHAHY